MAAFNGGVRLWKGYPRISAGKFRDCYLHVLIYEWFHGPIPEHHNVHHLDGDKSNFHPKNLVALPESEHGKISARHQWEMVHAARRRRAKRENQR